MHPLPQQAPLQLARGRRQHLLQRLIGVLHRTAVVHRGHADHGPVQREQMVLGLLTGSRRLLAAAQEVPHIAHPDDQAGDLTGRLIDVATHEHGHRVGTAVRPPHVHQERQVRRRPLTTQVIGLLAQIVQQLRVLRRHEVHERMTQELCRPPPQDPLQRRCHPPDEPVGVCAVNHVACRLGKRSIAVLRRLQGLDAGKPLGHVPPRVHQPVIHRDRSDVEPAFTQVRTQLRLIAIVVEHQRLSGLDHVLVHVEQAGRDMRRQEIQQSPADQIFSGATVVGTGRGIGIRVLEVHDLAGAVTDRDQEDVRIQQAVQRGPQATLERRALLKKFVPHPSRLGLGDLGRCRTRATRTASTDTGRLTVARGRDCWETVRGAGRPASRVARQEVPCPISPRPIVTRR